MALRDVYKRQVILDGVGRAHDLNVFKALNAPVKGVLHILGQAAGRTLQIHLPVSYTHLGCSKPCSEMLAASSASVSSSKVLRGWAGSGSISRRAVSYTHLAHGS